MSDAKKFRVGQRVRLLEDIEDDGADGHHPRGYFARKGEVVVVRHVRERGTMPVSVSHESITDNSFTVTLSEIEDAEGES